MSKIRRFIAATALLVPLCATVGSVTSPAQAATNPLLHDVMFVGNNWSGTASMVDARTFKVLKGGINLIPDKAGRLKEIYSDPVKLSYYLLVQQGPGEGHDQYVDDMFTTPNGRYLAVSRPSFADVIWVDIPRALAGRSDSIARRQPMDGHRSDHMTVSPNHKRLLVSDSTANTVHEYSMVTETVNGTTIKIGDRLRTFPSGETPHESKYTSGGTQIFHASIGKVYTPGDDPALDAAKGDRWFETVDNATFQVIRRWDMGKELAEAGYPQMSAAVRPMAVAPGNRYLYFQVSFYHGIVEFDTWAKDINNKVDYTLGGLPEPTLGAVKRLIPLPNKVPNLLREQYVNDSAHHGLSINPAGTTLCDAGTMDDYLAMVDRASGAYTLLDSTTTGHAYLKPYWTTEGMNNTCWVSLSGSDAVAVIDFATKKEKAFFGVGDHPQRIRQGVVRTEFLS